LCEEVGEAVILGLSEKSGSTTLREKEFLKRKTLLIFIDFSKYKCSFAALIKK